MTYQLEYKRDGSGFFEVGLAGETLGARKLVYLDTNGEWKLADANAVGEFPVVGITLETIPNGKFGRILTKGYVGDGSWSWASLGAPIYATSTPGNLSLSQPPDGTKVQIVAMVKENDLLLFDTGLNFQSSLFYANSNNYEDLRFPASAVRLGGAAPATTQAYKSGLVLSFASTPNQFMYVVAQIPHSWLDGGDIDAHLHWTLPVAGAGLGAENVKWDMTCSWSNIDALIPNATTSTVTVDVQDMAADMHMVTDFSALSGAAKTFSSIVIVSIMRDTGVANDYASAAYLMEFDFHYKRIRAGTLSEEPP